MAEPVCLNGMRGCAMTEPHRHEVGGAVSFTRGGAYPLREYVEARIEEARVCREKKILAHVEALEAAARKRLAEIPHHAEDCCRRTDCGDCALRDVLLGKADAGKGDPGSLLCPRCKRVVWTPPCACEGEQP